MPFGLTNAPGTFQRLMDCTRRELLWVYCMVYLDDIVIYSAGGSARHVELAYVLERLSEAGLTLKLAKCTFRAQQNDYLSHHLDEKRVRPLERLVQAVHDISRPTDAKEVKRFVHLPGYYRRFLAHFGSRAAPLAILLRKNVTWTWGAEEEAAFVGVKENLLRKPVLSYPDFAKPFTLAIDASLVGLGAALMQDNGAGLKPVAFASKAVTEAQAKYGITEIECLGSRLGDPLVPTVLVWTPYNCGHGPHSAALADDEERPVRTATSMGAVPSGVRLCGRV